MPGQKLHHQQLSERLGVSRTPVREALTRLVQEGYVSFLPNRGFTCKEIRLQEAEELYELRESLEAFAVEKAVEKLTDQALARACAEKIEFLRPRHRQPLHPRASGLRPGCSSGYRRNRRQRDLEEHLEPRIRAHRAQAPHRWPLRSGARPGRASRAFASCSKRWSSATLQAAVAYHAQPHYRPARKMSSPICGSARQSASCDPRIRQRHDGKIIATEREKYGSRFSYQRRLGGHTRCNI